MLSVLTEANAEDLYGRNLHFDTDIRWRTNFQEIQIQTTRPCFDWGECWGSLRTEFTLWYWHSMTNKFSGNSDSDDKTSCRERHCDQQSDQSLNWHNCCKFERWFPRCVWQVCPGLYLCGSGNSPPFPQALTFVVILPHTWQRWTLPECSQWTKSHVQMSLLLTKLLLLS